MKIKLQPVNLNRLHFFLAYFKLLWLHKPAVRLNLSVQVWGWGSRCVYVRESVSGSMPECVRVCVSVCVNKMINQRMLAQANCLSLLSWCCSCCCFHLGFVPILLFQKKQLKISSDPFWHYSFFNLPLCQNCYPIVWCTLELSSFCFSFSNYSNLKFVWLRLLVIM